jgi:uncharacterized protein (DUF924 family)
VTGDWRADVLKFWFGLEPEQWWRGGAELDHQIRRNFLKLWFEKRHLRVDEFTVHPLTALAAVVLFDQFPRNMFGGHADQFSTDPLALAIARSALDKGFDQQLELAERCFLYMPFEHSESMENQNRSVLLFTHLGNADWLNYAKKHRDIIDRFGRFPHRNVVLGRTPRPDEVAAGSLVPW